MAGEVRTYAVEGMTCEHCERSVREETEKLADVLAATADRETGRLTVRGESVDDEAVRRAVAAAGYRVTS